MKINVIDSSTGNQLFDYRSATVPRIDETILQNEDGVDLVVESVRHMLTDGGDPFVELYCKVL